MLALLVVADILARKKHHPRPRPDVGSFTGPGGFPGFGSGPGFGALPVVLFVVGVVIVGVIAYLSYQARQRRIAAWKALGAELGMTYAAADTRGLLELPFPILQRGDGRGIDNALHGTYEGLALDVFDYWYYEESTDAQGHRSRSTYRFDCVATTFDADGGSLSIAEENLFTALADAVSLRDQQFESEVFNRMFNVKAADPVFATAVLDARMMDWLMEHGTGHRFAIEGRHVLVVHDRVEVTELTALMATTAAFVAQIPRVVSSLYPKSG